MAVKFPIIDYYNKHSGGREADLRSEIINTFDGSAFEIPKSRKVLLRQFRRDINNKLIPCSCVDSLTGEPDKDHFCPISFSEKYLWDEKIVDSYKVVTPSNEVMVEPGLLNVSTVVFYMRYDIGITSVDKIAEVELDSEGLPVSPLTRIAIYRIQTLEDLRADRGRIEYWKAVCTKEFVKFLNVPG